MIKSWFENEERIKLLVYRALQWKGTHWMANSEALQIGVSCHNLPRSLYIEAGFLTQSFPKITGTPNESRFAKESKIEQFIGTRQEFVRTEVNALMPGDLIGLRIQRVTDHLGIVLPGGKFIHVLMHKMTCIDLHHVYPWSSRITAVWRPVTYERQHS